MPSIAAIIRKFTRLGHFPLASQAGRLTGPMFYVYIFSLGTTAVLPTLFKIIWPDWQKILPLRKNLAPLEINLFWSNFLKPLALTLCFLLLFPPFCIFFLFHTMFPFFFTSSFLTLHSPLLSFPSPYPLQCLSLFLFRFHPPLNILDTISPPTLHFPL
jgi:hypothetical protein